MYFYKKIGNDFMPDNGSIFTYIFNNCSTPNQHLLIFSKNDPNNLRLMTYNVLSNGLINNSRLDVIEEYFLALMFDIITYQSVEIQIIMMY